MPPIFLALLVVYSAALIALGVWMSRRVRQTGDFFVSGRTLGAGLVFATFLAPNIGAGSTVGATGYGYTDGLSAWWWNGSAGLGSLVLAFFVGPRIWREASRLKLLTVGDFLDHHFGPQVRSAAAVLIWLGTLFVLCAQLNGVAAVLGLPHAVGSLIGAGVMTAYFIAGGLASAARVNAVQLTVKLIGFALAAPLAIAAVGGFAHLQTISAGRWDVMQVGADGIGWPLLFLLGPAFFLSPGLVQKAYGAKDERALRRGVAWNGLGLMLFAFLPVTLGLCARAIDPNLAHADDALRLVLTRVPAAVGGFALAAVFSAELSAGDAVLFMLSTSGARDIYLRLFRPGASDRQVLLAARVAACLGGALAYALTFRYAAVGPSLQMFYGVLVVSLFAPILGGLYLPRGGRRGALAAMVTGVAVFAALRLYPGPAGAWWLSPNLAGLVASSAAYALIAILLPAPPRLPR